MITLVSMRPGSAAALASGTHGAGTAHVRLAAPGILDRMRAGMIVASARRRVVGHGGELLGRAAGRPGDRQTGSSGGRETRRDGTPAARGRGDRGPARGAFDGGGPRPAPGGPKPRPGARRAREP